MAAEWSMVGTMPREEWDALPAHFDAETMARVLDKPVRFIYRHHEDLGGRKIGGVFFFSKERVSDILGLG